MSSTQQMERPTIPKGKRRIPHRKNTPTLSGVRAYQQQSKELHHRNQTIAFHVNNPKPPPPKESPSNVNDAHLEQSVEDEEHYHPFQKRFTASVSDESLHAAMTLVEEDFRADLKQAVEEEEKETSETLEEIRNKKQRTSSFFNDPNNVPRAR